MKNMLSFIFVFLLLPLLAVAQTVNPDACGALAKNFTISIKNDPNYAGSPCAPANLGGTGTLGRWIHQNGGIVAWTYCNDGFSYFWQIGVVKDSLLTDPTLIADWMAVEFADDKAAALQNFQHNHITLPLTDVSLLPIWCPSIHAIVEAKPAPIPYIVMPSQTASARYVYAVSASRNGSRNTSKPAGVVNMKNADGTPTKCDCMSARVIEGSQTYCSVNGQSLQVTACVKQ